MELSGNTIPINKIKPNPENPRVIHDDKFRKLCESLKAFPQMMEKRPIVVDENWVILGGNMRYRALKENGMKQIPVEWVSIAEGWTDDQKKEFVIKDNAGFGEWDWDALANWDVPLADWGVDVPEWDGNGGGDEADDEAAEIERKRKEFEDRIKAGEISEEDEEYQEFLEKFKLKKTTDDCYTPPIVYDAVADWVSKKYNISKAKFVRPFYPGGDYQKENYPNGCVVVDNPPFSIMAEILKFYHSHCIKFFLFGPHLTLFSSSSSSSSAIVTGVPITYENGANVNTSFLTNLEPASVRFKSEPSLYAAIKAANDENLKSMRKSLPKYSYDHHLVTTPFLSALSRLGIEFSVSVSESHIVDQLDCQKESGKAIFGKGYLISEAKFAEREKAEREKAEREKAEREKAERWELSDREREIIAKLG